MRFQKSARLLRPADFTQTLTGGIRLQGRALEAVVRVSGGTRARLGLAISRRTLALATRRNHLKRIVRESFRQHAQALPAVDVVVSARRAVTASTDPAVREELLQLWARIAERCRIS